MLERRYCLQGTRGLGFELFAADVSEPQTLILSGRAVFTGAQQSDGGPMKSYAGITGVWSKLKPVQHVGGF